MAENTICRSDEKLIPLLRDLYRSYGYSCFKMSKFEEYDLYVQNKEFLVSDSVITFTDTNGKLMALKPDVTLSIVKNTTDVPGYVKRLYYHENVYRISEKTHHYKEIMQTGLECIGSLTTYNLCEVIRLAALSLRAISDECVLNISHLGVLSALLRDLDLGTEQAALLQCLSEKNAYGVSEICARHHVEKNRANLLATLTQAFGDPADVAAELKKQITDAEALAALDEFTAVSTLCRETTGVRICADFSLINDMNYYNGLVFRGYVKGVPTGVLSGGQYDRLMKKMGKTARAIGFAVYLDLLERLEKESDFDVDVLLLCDEDTPAADIVAWTNAYAEQGQRVTVQTAVPPKLRYRTLDDRQKKKEVSVKVTLA